MRHYSFNNEKEEKVFLTDQAYFNIPDIDNTMPFNVIALTWVIFGFLFIQTLNMYLADKEKTFISKLKDKIVNFFKKRK